MIPDITVQRLRRLRAEGFSLRKISSTTGVSVNTIRSYLSQPNKGLVPKPTQFRKSRLDAIPREDYESMYSACRGNYAALALAFALFMKEKGNPDFSISRSAVRRYSLSRYPDLKQPAPEPAPFFVEPGQQLQIDFVECRFQFTGDAQPSKIKVFEAIYSYSRRAFILICPDLSQKSWLTGIVRCLAKWGIPRQILCDNDASLVRRGIHPGKAKFNPRFCWLCDSIGVNPKACRPLTPRTKGRVERFGGTLKSNAIAVAQALINSSSGREIRTNEQLQEFVDEWLVLTAKQLRFLHHDGKTKASEDELYEIERKFLLFPEKLSSLLNVSTYPIHVSAHGSVYLHGLRFLLTRHANQDLEVTFRADGAFFITTQSGTPVFQSQIPDENLSKYRWNDRPPQASQYTEIPAQTQPETDPYLEYVKQLLLEE